MPTTEEIVTIYKSKVDEHIKGLEEIIEAERRAGREKGAGEAADKAAATTAVSAAAKRSQAIKQEEAILKQLAEAKKKAFTVKEIDEYNKKIAESERNIKTLQGSTEKTQGILSGGFKKLGGAIAAAFAVQQVIAFGKAAITAFAEAQKGQLQLLSSLGGQEDIQKRLIRQADDLQGKFGIDNDVIVRQQAFLAIQGRTESQIKRTIQAAIQLSAVTGEDLSSSVEKLDATFEGNIGRLGKLDERFKDMTATQLANGSAIDLVNEKYQGFAEAGAASVSGQLEIQQRRIDDLTKEIGGKLAPAWVGLKTVAVEALASILRGFNEVASRGGASTARALEEGKAAIEVELEKQFAAKKTFEVQKALNDAKNRQITLEVEERKAGKGKSLADLKFAQQELALNAVRIKTLEGILLQKRKERAIDTQQIENLQTLKAELEKLKAAQETISSSDKAQLDANLKAQLDVQKKIDDITGKSAEERLKLEEEISKKIIENKEKQVKAEQQAQASLQEFTFKSFEDNITDEETRLKEFARTQSTSSQELGIRLEQIDIDTLKKRRDLRILFGKSVTDIDKAIEDKMLEVRKDGLENWEKSNDEFKQKYLDFQKQLAEDNIEIAKDEVAERNEIIRSSFDLAREFGNLLSQFTRQNSDERISILEEQKESVLTAIDAEQAALDESRNKKLIGERAYEAQSATIKQRRLAEEKKLNEKINAERRKEALRERAIAVFNVILNTAQAMTKVSAQTGILTFAFSPLIAALGALQLAAVLSAPLPKFARGTKDKSGSGLSIVGERGTELVNLPDGSQVLPNSKYNKHKPYINAMFDDELMSFINQQHVLPALIHQKKRYEEEKKKDFASNIAGSLLLNARSAGMDEYAMMRALNQTNPNLAKEIGAEVARQINKNGSYSAYH